MADGGRKRTNAWKRKGKLFPQFADGTPTTRSIGNLSKRLTTSPSQHFCFSVFQEERGAVGENGRRAEDAVAAARSDLRVEVVQKTWSSDMI